MGWRQRAERTVTPSWPSQPSAEPASEEDWLEVKEPRPSSAGEEAERLARLQRFWLATTLGCLLALLVGYAISEDLVRALGLMSR